MKIGILPTGDTAVRAAHSISAHPGVDRVVVIGPARSSYFKVVNSVDGLDLLVGTGSAAPGIARKHGLPLVWDGNDPEPGALVWGGSPQGLVLALAADDRDPRLVALAHPDLTTGGGRQIRFPDPIGPTTTTEAMVGGRLIALGKAEDGFAACYVRSVTRTLTIVDDARFMKGVALAATIALVGSGPTPVWDQAFTYLHTATEMGLVIGEA